MNVLTIFQRPMNTLLSDTQNNRCFFYLDNIMIHEDALENHNKRLFEVLARLSQNNLIYIIL